MSDKQRACIWQGCESDGVLPYSRSLIEDSVHPNYLKPYVEGEHVWLCDDHIFPSAPFTLRSLLSPTTEPPPSLITGPDTG